MLAAYSQRIMPPYSGVVQVVESERARAMSFDGLSWDLHFASGSGRVNQKQGYAVGKGYYHVAHWQDGKLTPYNFAVCLDPDEVTEGINELANFLDEAEVPFPIADVYEYWLLDGRDKSPLALIFSCCEESQMEDFPAKNEWTAIPHSKMEIHNTEGERARGEAPVNHRFQRAVASRAGMNPQGAWFKRDADQLNGFPALLVREDWDSLDEQDLCERYIGRMSPRLLMLQGLPEEDRERLELAAKQHVQEVDEYFPMFPQILDEKRMSAMRVEARLRRVTPDKPKAGEEKSTGPVPLSKDMRILE